MNFKNFFSSFITLQILSTGENWVAVNRDLMTVSPATSLVFFVVYNLVVSVLFVNLLLAITVAQFDASYR